MKGLLQILMIAGAGYTLFAKSQRVYGVWEVLVPYHVIGFSLWNILESNRKSYA